MFSMPSWEDEETESPTYEEFHRHQQLNNGDINNQRTFIMDAFNRTLSDTVYYSITVPYILL